MSSGPACKCWIGVINILDDWVVVDRERNYSAFSGYRYTPSNYSSVRCLKCGRTWRTKAGYVKKLQDATREERTKVI